MELRVQHRRRAPSEVTITVDMPAEMSDRLERVASKEHVPASSIVVGALRFIFSRLSDGALARMMREYASARTRPR